MIGRLAFIGLTGGIGTGKSTVARLVAERGVPVLDADQIAREVVEPGTPAHAQIATAWPAVIGPDGRIDRRALAGIVFADRAARAKLEGITHPRIAARADELAWALERQGHRLAFYEASLLVETGRHRDFDALVVVTAPVEVQIARASARDGRPASEIEARIRAQMPMAEKVRHATHVIDNGGTLEATRAAVDQLLAELDRRFGVTRT